MTKSNLLFCQIGSIDSMWQNQSCMEIHLWFFEAWVEIQMTYPIWESTRLIIPGLDSILATFLFITAYKWKLGQSSVILFRQTTPSGRHPLGKHPYWAETLPRQTPSPKMVTEAIGRHSTGEHICCLIFLTNLTNLTNLLNLISLLSVQSLFGIRGYNLVINCN